MSQANKHQLTPQEFREAARKLYEEHKTEYAFYTPQQRAGFRRRCKNLAGKILIPMEASNEDHDVNLAVMTLDVIALRCGDQYFQFANEL